ncbi:MAG: hypothetical protein KDE31_21205, partial [Caldilineaceae bacterium]|nr:hypothetical protein [Caldilineaceae bacterium]
MIRLRDAGIETIVGTSHRLTQNENDEFALTFYRYFTTTDRSVRYAFAEAISAAQISTSNQKGYFAGLHGRGNLRRWWINVGNRRNTGQLSPNIIGNDAFFEERLGRLKNDWPSVVNSGQAAAMLAYHATVLAPPRGRTETEIQAEFARWGNSSLKLAERLSKLSLLSSSGSTGALIYQGDATLDTAIFKELYTANNNLARFRQFVANLVSLPQRIQRTAYTAYQKAIALPARIWKWGQRYAQRFAWGAVVVGATIILGLALQALMLKNQLQMDLARHVGELSSPTQFILSRQAEEKPIMDRVMEWFTGYDPLRPSEVNFQLIGPLPSPAALEEGTAHTHWQRIL